MGLLETAASNLSYSSVALFVIGLVLLRHVVSRIDEHIRIKRLGGHGHRMSSWAPFGTVLSFSLSSLIP